MDQELVTKAAVIAAGVFVGGGFLVWFAKLMASRLIRQYDDKHAEHEKRLTALSDKFSEYLMDLKLKLAKLEPMVASAISLRDDLKSAEGDIAVLEHRMDEAAKDINQAHGQIRLVCKKLEH